MGSSSNAVPNGWLRPSGGPTLSNRDRQTLADSLSISRRAVDLLWESEVVDQHVDAFIWHRIFGYDLRIWHGPGPLHARYLGQTDLPRLRAAGVSSATWVITTNPWRSRRGRLRALLENFKRLTSLLSHPTSQAQVVSSFADYEQARQRGKHAAFIGLQGGNALSDPVSSRVFSLDQLLRVTLVHLTDSDLGQTSTPLPRSAQDGLRPRGRELIRELQAAGVSVDLAHASKRTFWDAIGECRNQKPVIVSHTGFSAVSPHWRNLDDDQARAIADSGGVIGVLFHGPFLGGAPWGGRVMDVACHLQHGIKLLGASHVTLGSDWDGLIATPIDMPTCLELPRLVQALLDLKVPERDIRLVLGRSFLDFVKRVRP